MAAYPPTDEDRRIEEIKFMREKLGLPFIEPRAEDGRLNVGYHDTSWHNLYNQLSQFQKESPDFGMDVDEAYPELARLKVWSDNVVETFTMDAAACMYAANRDPNAPFIRWCGGRSRSLYESYGRVGLRRFNVLPNGPDTWVEIDGQSVPVASDAYTFAVASDGRATNVNDYQNRYLGKGMDVENGIKAARILDRALGFNTGAFFGAGSDSSWNGFDGYPEAWADEGFTADAAELWRNMLRHVAQYDWLFSFSRYDDKHLFIDNEKKAAGVADFWRSKCGGDHILAESWAEAGVGPYEAYAFINNDITVEQFEAFVSGDEPYAYDPGSITWNTLNFDPRDYIECIRKGITHGQLREVDRHWRHSPSEEEMSAILALVEADLPLSEEAMEWVAEDVARRAKWIRQKPSEEEVAFIVDNGLDVGQSPASFIRTWKKLEAEGKEPFGTSVMELLGKKDEIEKARQEKK